MNALRGLAWLLVLQLVGEVLARAFSLPLPGPVIGMLLLMPALGWRPLREPVTEVARFLLAHLSLLFVPVGVADKIGGVPALAAVFAVLTGLIGALSGKYLFAMIGVGTDRVGWMARGFAMGTAAHGIGAARSLQVNAEAGAYAGLALGLQVLLASVLMPLAARWF